MFEAATVGEALPRVWPRWQRPSSLDSFSRRKKFQALALICIDICTELVFYLLSNEAHFAKAAQSECDATFETE